ncbi:MAG: glycine--tRNA ligase subunit beta [Elusimicrobia bacterium]|nr:glycine--tRNA ligase subunit beta [Elusimicrobiota bacterium]
MTAGRKRAVDFLLDVHTEPFPARFVQPALDQLRTGAARRLEGRLAHGEIAVSGTLRHLILSVKDVAPKGFDKTERFKGPKEGAPASALEGFARRHGLTPADLKPEGGAFYAEVHAKGEAAGALLQAMIPELLESLQFPKFMTWEESGFKFGRPLRAITALLGDKVVSVKIAGVKSGRSVHGHPALAKAPAALRNPAEHEAALRRGLVIANPEERRRYLLKALEQAAKPAGGGVELDAELIEETVFMVEHPVPVLGRLREEHMLLPPALLKMVMMKQLKFFPVVARGGLPRPYFIGVRDGLSLGNELVREGYQRVLEARFNDAAFFLGRDRSSTLESKLPLLERVTYQKALGSMAQKAARVEALAAWIGERLRATFPADEGVVARAAKLAYGDLVTDVVKEFPELQGRMGGEYARKDGESEKVALAVEQFYYPVAAKTPVPATLEAAVVSLAGKLDGLAGCFAAGMIPTGSTDPYALRRQALGLIRTVLEKQLPLDLEEAIARAVALQPVSVAEPARLAAQLADFLWGRAQSLFEDMQYAVDEVRSVRAGALKNLPGAFLRLSALRAVRRDPSFDPLAAAFKRASNILRQAKGDEGVPVERSLLREQADLDLYDALVVAEGAANDRILRGDFEGGLKTLVSVKPHLDHFFENVMVMAEDAGLRRQRLALLSKLVRAFRRVADLSEIQAPAS